MTDRELLIDAVEAMKSAIESGDWKVDGACDPHATIIRITNRLAQPEPEPAFYVIQATDRFGEGYEQTYWKDPLGFPVYTAPPKHEWVGLTDEEVNDISGRIGCCLNAIHEAQVTLKEKNT